MQLQIAENEMVVICFQISIFEPLNTANLKFSVLALRLWFAFKLVSLNHWIQPKSKDPVNTIVVICFQISIFEPLNTALLSISLKLKTLWFAFKLVSLNHWIQLLMEICLCLSVVICFQISIFEPLNTAVIWNGLTILCCDLLSN